MKFFIAVILLVAVALANRNIELTDKDFKNGRVMNKKSEVQGKWFIKFYAPWCPHCQRLQPFWEEMSDSLPKDIKVGALDCTQYDDICTQLSVYGYPTLKYMDETLGSVKYEGARTTDDMVDWIKQEKYKESEKKSELPLLEFKNGFQKIAKLLGFN